MNWRSSIHSRIAQIVDYFTALTGFIVSYYLTGFLYQYSSFFGQKFPIIEEHLLLTIILSLFYVYLFNVQKAYSYQRFTSLLAEYFIIFKVALIGFVVTIALIFMYRFYIPRTTVMLTFVVFVLSFIIQKTIMFFVAAYFRKKGHNTTYSMHRSQINTPV